MGCFTAQADVSVPNIFSDHMVLQQKQQNKVWGKAAAGEKVTVAIGGQNHAATTDDTGMWSVMIDPLDVGGPYELVDLLWTIQHAMVRQ
jgi:sialate O-acetylesterase